MTNEIQANQIGLYRQLALVRMHLAFTGYTHERLSEFNDKAATIFRQHYQTAADSPKILALLKEEWGKSFATWLEAFESARYQAAALAFGELALMHRRFMSLVYPITESKPDFPPVFEQQLEDVVRAAEERVHGDGFKLSERLWRHDRESWEGIKRTVLAGIADQKSAWALAQDMEQYLGAYADCPRWTSTRLYKLTKADIAAGNTTGLLKGSDCSPEKGVAYNALRLARTEISFASNTATEAIHNRSPWVEAVKINLSPSHPEPDICDDYANGGNGKGVYPVGEVDYPPYHPHCSPAGQKITTEAGPVNIEDVREGDRVLTHKGRYRPVTATMKRQYADVVYRIKTAGGRELTLTPDHPILINGEWKPIQQAVIGDKVTVDSR